MPAIASAKSASPALFILSEPSVASYGTIGRLYHATFRAMGRRSQVVAYGSPLPAMPRGSIVLHNTLGFRFAPLAGMRNIAVPFHEWNRYPAAWAARLNAFDEVWAASRYLSDVLRQSGVEVPIRVVPPALDLTPPANRVTWTTTAPFRFLFVGEPHFRKGHHLLIEGYRRLDAGPRRATLTLKTAADCAWSVSEPGITRVATRWPAARMRRLYAEFDGFISASLGEGLGLGVAEAMLAQVPVATNRWGGHTALLAPDGYVRIAHRVVDQPFCSRPDFYAPGQQCALSSPDAVAAAMATMLSMTARQRREMAARASAVVRERFGFDVCSRRLGAALAAADE